MFNYDTFRVNLALHRKARGMSQEELADKADISEKNLSRIELGKQEPNLQTIVSILNVFQLTTSEFMEYGVDAKNARIKNIISYLPNFSVKGLKFILTLAKRINRTEVT